MNDPDDRTLAEILPHWEWPPEIEATRIGDGLINQSYRITGDRRILAIAQGIDPSIVPIGVNADLDMVTRHLEHHGIAAPRLIRTRNGARVTDIIEGLYWRCLTPVGSRTIHSISDPIQAHSAGRLVARFHRALTDLDGKLTCPKQEAQNTERHLAALDNALREHPRHRLRDPVAAIADELVGLWRQWPDTPQLPIRIVHGDLKLSNLRFDGDHAVALIDFDTLANATLEVELGDAMRSWCNPAGEDCQKSTCDPDIFTAAVSGLATEGQGLMNRDEWQSIVTGMTRITLNLTARFAADALNESYFGWNPAYGSRGDHNLVRAEGQLSLLHSVLNQRSKLEASVDAILREHRHSI